MYKIIFRNETLFWEISAVNLIVAWWLFANVQWNLLFSLFWYTRDWGLLSIYIPFPTDWLYNLGKSHKKKKLWIRKRKLWVCKRKKINSVPGHCMNSPGTALFVVIGLFQFKILLVCEFGIWVWKSYTGDICFAKFFHFNKEI